ncbi:MAG: hypothetical protein EA376_03335 [Phycisphaeraceae bacterium]|nr:MAG: hypothetical protein EA376_03335 [Phycisphaeraceae bacterium]
MNRDHAHTWSDLDVERYHDGDMPDDLARAFTRDLMADAALRARLDAVRRVDEVARAALLAAPAARTAPPRPPIRRLMAAAAMIALVAGAGLVTWRFTTAPAPSTAGESQLIAQDDTAPPEAPAPRTGPFRPGDVVLTITHRPGAAPSSSSRAPAPSRSVAAPSTVDELDAALRRGDALHAMRLLNERDADGAGLERIGALFLSADTAREALDMLPPQRRLDAIRIWAARPALRPVVFPAFADMLADPATADAARALRRELADIPELRPWLASYASR